MRVAAGLCCALRLTLYVFRMNVVMVSPPTLPLPPSCFSSSESAARLRLRDVIRNTRPGRGREQLLYSQQQETICRWQGDGMVESCNEYNNRLEGLGADETAGNAAASE